MKVKREIVIRQYEDGTFSATDSWCGLFEFKGWELVQEVAVVQRLVMESTTISALTKKV